jgi:hypothetical protein
MWPLPKISNKNIHIVIQPEQLGCYYFNKADTLASTNIIHEQFDIPLITEAVIHNPSSITQAIQTFITKHHIEYAFSYLVLGKPLVKEQLVAHAHTHAQLQDLVTPGQAMHYYHRYIGPHQNSSLFYVCAISRSLLLQLHIMHARLKLHMQAVRPPLSIQHDLYTYLYPAQTSLAAVVQAVDPDTITFKKLFESTSLHPSMHHNNALYNENLVYALGSLLGSKT